MKVLIVVGTRPEAVKMAPVVIELRKRLPSGNVILCSTGQHREMLDSALGAFNLSPDVELSVMKSDQALSSLTSELFRRVDSVVHEEKPDWVLVQGDTTSAMVAALVGFYYRVRVGHVEAGLRTNDRQHPFPEEINRRIVDLVADAYFAPTADSASNLSREGVPGERIHVTGNTVVDALKWMAKQAYDWTRGPFAAVDRNKKLVLITVHRRESFGKPLEEIVSAIADLHSEFGSTHEFVWPVHLNPNVQRVVESRLGDRVGLHLLPPIDYRSMIQAMQSSTLILTDSGGVQEEAPTFGVPVLVLRETTERPEGVAAGVAKLVGSSRERIVKEASKFLSMNVPLQTTAHDNPYGDGRAAERIANVLVGS